VSQATRLQKQLERSPWPTPHAPIIFLLDTSRGYEQQLLTRWITTNEAPSQSAIVLCLNLRNDRKALIVDALAEALITHPDAYVAPLRVSWLSPKRDTRSGPQLADLIRGGERRPSNWLARFVAHRHPERIHLTSGEPGSSQDLGDRFHRKTGVLAAQQPEDFAVFVARQAAVVLDIAERQLIGGRYKVPRYVRQSLRHNLSFKAGLRNIANESERSTKAVRAEANQYLKEMISIPTRFWLDVWAKVCGICLGLGYDRALQYDPKDVERVRQIVRQYPRQYPSALLWTHKTYIDGFVVPKILFDNNFPMPHFFGGANLNVPILGFLLRRAGGIFIRRSFQDNEIYKLSLKQYIGYLMEKRFPMTWSFEGTRSRLGKLMPPKYGLLKYVLEGAHHAGSQDIHIIPVSVSYDLIRDAEEYAREQSGTPKAPESIGWLIRYLRSLARPMGRIHVDFGQPVCLPIAPDPSDQLAISKIAFQVAVEAKSLLGAFPRALTEAEIIRDVTVMTQWATSRGVRLSPDFNVHFANDMRSLLSNMIKEGIITAFDGGPETVYGIADGQAPIASFYRNTIVHFFLSRAVAEVALLAVSESTEEAPLTCFWREVRALRDQFKFEFFYPDSQAFEAQINEELCLEVPDWQHQLSDSAENSRKILNTLAPKLAHVALTVFAEAYSIGADVLMREASTIDGDEEAFVELCMSFGKQAYLQRRISSEASIGKLLFANSWKALMNRGAADSDEDLARYADDLNQLVRRLEVIRALSIAERGGNTLRDVARETI